MSVNLCSFPDTDFGYLYSMCAMPGSKFFENQEAYLHPEFNIFDRNPDPALDELVELAAVLCGADYAYIGWMDFNRLWFKARFGFKAIEQSRAVTACQWMLEKGEPLLIPNAAEDRRFLPQGIPVPGAKPALSYAGTPLITSAQQMVGTFALLAVKPNQFQQEHLTLLEILGRQAVTRLELYSRIRLQEQAQRLRQRTERALAIERCFVAATLDSIPALVAVLDTAGRLVRMNQPCVQLTGLSLADAVGRPFVDQVLKPDDREWAVGKLREAAAGQESGPARNAWLVGGDPGSPAARSAARELDAAPSAGSERRNSIRDRQRPGRDRPAADGRSSAVQRSALPRGGGELAGLCLHLLDGRTPDLAERLYCGNPGLPRRGAHRARRHRADGCGRSGRISGVPAAPSKLRRSGRARCPCAAATASTAASRSAAGACNFPASGPLCSTTAWT